MKKIIDLLQSGKSKEDIQDAVIQNLDILQEQDIPWSKEAEEGILSCMLQWPDECIPTCIKEFKKGYIFHSQYEEIYNAIIYLYEKDDVNLENNVVVLIHYLKEKKKLDQVGGAAAISELFSFTPIPSHFRYFLNVLKEKYQLRKIIQICGYTILKAQQSACHDLESNQDLLLELESDVFSLTDEHDSDVKKISAPVLDALDDIQYSVDNPGKLFGLSTGFKGIDKLTSGLKGGDMFVLAARPSMGKTSLAMNMLEHIALIEEKPVVIFTLEVSAKILVKAEICRLAGISMHDITSGLITKAHQQALAIAIARLQRANIFIDDTSAQDVKLMRSKLKRLKRKHNIKVAIVDYLQLATCSGESNREREISKISATLKATAKELDIPIIVLAQLNRSVENRKENRPVLSDLRESGSVEQDADIVGLLTRPSYYGNKKSKEEAEIVDEREAMLIIAKNRNGPTDDVPLLFDKSITRFSEPLNN